MKLFSKLFLVVSFILCLALSVSGYFLMTNSFQDSIRRETEKSLDSYQVTKYMLQSSLAGIDTSTEMDKSLFLGLIPDVVRMNVEKNRISLFDREKKAVCVTYPGDAEDLVALLPEGRNLNYQVHKNQEIYYLTVAGRLKQGDKPYYLAVSTDITEIFERQSQMEFWYVLVYGITCVVGLIAMFTFSTVFVRPVKKMSASARQIAAGSYEARVLVSSHDELGELASSFNKMADAVEKSIEELKQSVVEKEDFVANFAHELKTPLTSVIGYADMLYQKELDRQQVKESAKYILEEGLRLEALSYKLMELIVLHRQEFVFEKLSFREILENILETLQPLLTEKSVELECELEDAELMIEVDLFKTMILNFVDNAVKAKTTVLRLVGKTEGERYLFTIRDNGCGIPGEALNRITEAFYMVDKSRSRKQHGAGIGLALAARIAALHHARLTFESELGEGTTVAISLPLPGGEA